jgi:hypothetical protein
MSYKYLAPTAMKMSNGDAPSARWKFGHERPRIFDYSDAPYRIRKHGNAAMLIGIMLMDSISIGAFFEGERTVRNNEYSF